MGFLDKINYSMIVNIIDSILETIQHMQTFTVDDQKEITINQFLLANCAKKE